MGKPKTRSMFSKEFIESIKRCMSQIVIDMVIQPLSLSSIP